MKGMVDPSMFARVNAVNKFTKSDGDMPDTVGEKQDVHAVNRAKGTHVIAWHGQSMDTTKSTSVVIRVEFKNLGGANLGTELAVSALKVMNDVASAGGRVVDFTTDNADVNMQFRQAFTIPWSRHLAAIKAAGAGDDAQAGAGAGAGAGDGGSGAAQPVPRTATAATTATPETPATGRRASSDPDGPTASDDANVRQSTPATPTTQPRAAPVVKKVNIPLNNIDNTFKIRKEFSKDTLPGTYMGRMQRATYRSPVSCNRWLTIPSIPAQINSHMRTAKRRASHSQFLTH